MVILYLRTWEYHYCLYLIWAGDVIEPAVLLHPGCFPKGSICVFIKIAANHSEQWDQVEHREDPHTDHELHQFGLVLLLQGNLHADPVQSHNAH